MNIGEIKRMAKGMGINTYRTKKTDIIRAIQREERNNDCYGTSRVENCHEVTCLWKRDCVSVLNSGKGLAG